jgi:formylglycine-generating enzyme required for sulfatase activity
MREPRSGRPLALGTTVLRDQANVLNSVSSKPVGSYPTGVNWVGANDMAGNAMEWVSDWLGVDYFATSPRTDTTGPATGAIKVEKGGSWGSNEFVARSAYRHDEDPPTYGDKHIGFRVASP